MSQKIIVKQKDPAAGGERRIELKVVRTWSSPGSKLHLTAAGDYVQGDGAPPESERMLDVIPDKHQREAAAAWWRRRGEAYSKSFYSARNSALKKRHAAAAGDTALETRYTRVPAGGGEPEGPFSWAETFSAPPQWWGHVDMTIVDRVTYIREGVSHDTAPAVEKATPRIVEDENALPPEPGPPIDPLTPVVATVYKDQSTKYPSKRFTGPHLQAMADAEEWLKSRDPDEYAAARIEALPVDGEAQAPTVDFIPEAI